jgi:hypothetical protein
VLGALLPTAVVVGIGAKLGSVVLAPPERISPMQPEKQASIQQTARIAESEAKNFLLIKTHLFSYIVYMLDYNTPILLCQEK